MNIFRNTLFIRVLSLCVFFLLVAMSFMAYLLVEENQKKHENFIYSQILGHAESLSRGSTELLLSEEYDLLESWNSAATPTKSYAYSYIADGSGLVIVHTNLEFVGSKIDLYPKNNQFSKLVYNNQSIIEVTRKIIVGERVIGYAAVAFYESEGKMTIYEIIKNISTPIIFMAIFLIFSIYLMLRNIVVPLSKLTVSIQNNQLGKALILNNSILKRNDEIGLLARSFNNLIKKTNESFAKIEELNNCLEQKISEKTRKLQIALQKMEKCATVDPLTGAFNRRKFNELIENAIYNTQRDNNALSLFFFDIDHFKKINDNFGHDVGDTTLIEIVNISNKILRKTDFLVRWGGEEFLAILSNIDRKKACQIAERLRVAIELYDFPTIAANVTVSIGVVEYDIGESATKLVSRADELLYFAKDHGRNMIADKFN